MKDAGPSARHPNFGFQVFTFPTLAINHTLVAKSRLSHRRCENLKR